MQTTITALSPTTMYYFKLKAYDEVEWNTTNPLVVLTLSLASERPAEIDGGVESATTVEIGGLLSGSILWIKGLVTATPPARNDGQVGTGEVFGREGFPAPG